MKEDAGQDRGYAERRQDETRRYADRMQEDRKKERRIV